MTLTVGSLFTGIGGFDLGFERAGMHVKWQCEQNDYCRAVLAKHWPDVPCHRDVRDIGHGTERVDVLCGGFPCQDISLAGKGAGLDGERSGLWSEFARIIGELRPRFVVVENVPALRSRGLGRVLGEMATLGYDAEWDCIPARAVGAPHQRDRIWLVAYPECEQLRKQSRRCGREGRPDQALIAVNGQDGDVANAHGEPALGFTVSRAQRHSWQVEPDVGRVANGVPARVDRLRALGNALVPQIAEIIGRRIGEIAD